MALSNWDTFAKDFDNNSVPGVFETEQVKVEIYKNWLHITAGEMKATIHEGNITIGDVEIFAVRGPQNGVYVYCRTGYEHNDTIKGMVGCGVYGYEDEEFIGVTKECLEFLRQQIEEWDKKHAIYFPYCIMSFDDGKRYNQGDAYFAEQLKLPVEEVATKVGEQKSTILSQACEKMSENIGEKISGEENSEM
tara:strand:+ start:51558 stop:52133 length:576 start_codon:yes stop_codon:yes gene_type:complete